jgi:ligand-binding sensor domain-containing protein
VNALLFVIVLVCSLLSPNAHAEQPSLPLDLPQLNIAALAASCTKLYVGGFDGGLYTVERSGKVQRFRDAALSPHINALAWSEREQVLWLGTARGLTRCHMVDAPSCSRLGPSSAVHALLLRSDGSLVAGGDAGLSFVESGKLHGLGKKQAAPYRSVWAVAEAVDGTLFAGASNGLFWAKISSIRRGEATFQRASVVSGALPDDWVTALLVRGDRVHVGTYNAGVATLRLDREQLRPESVDSSLGYVNPAGLVAIDDDVLAVATMDGLRFGTPGDTNVSETRARDITAVTPAWSGGYWIGTRTGLEWTAALSV